jgi:hypothetical protein
MWRKASRPRVEPLGSRIAAWSSVPPSTRQPEHGHGNEASNRHPAALRHRLRALARAAGRPAASRGGSIDRDAGRFGPRRRAGRGRSTGRHGQRTPAGAPGPRAGAPRTYIAYCAATTDSAALFAKLAELARAEEALNRASGTMSTCEYRMPPTATLQGGHCVAVASQGEPVQ